MASTQFAALPFRISGDQVSVLLITTRRKRRWSVPKGWPVPAARPHRTAEIEAYEEAGLIGNAAMKPVGRYRHTKKKRKRKIKCDITLFPLEVIRQKARWPERGQRRAIWLPADQAAALVHKPRLKRLIGRFARQKQRKLQTQPQTMAPCQAVDGDRD